MFIDTEQAANMTPDACLRFVPSAVEGVSRASEVVVFPDRLEILAEGGSAIVRFLEIAQWRRHAWFYRGLVRLGLGVRGWPSVGDRDWFHPPDRRFFRFYTTPAITVFMPDEPTDVDYGQTIFRRLQDIMQVGGFSTYDLG